MTSVILASGSEIRAKLLCGAGVPFEVEIARIDETAIIASLKAEQAKPHEIVDTLAEYKAQRVAARHIDSLVIGCDQILVCDKKIYEKAVSLEAVREKLLTLRGKPHQLMSAVVIFENGRPVWRHVGRAQLIMRDFSDDFLDDYIEQQGDGILSSVGCYKLEETGAQLFSHIQGDYFTILGIPLLEVLGFLRTRGVLVN
ncbi:MAG: septum formation protein Maf [Amylibacter sp.]|nr:septum formation protein Maf [Amylibacter sp.]